MRKFSSRAWLPNARRLILKRNASSHSHNVSRSGHSNGNGNGSSSSFPAKLDEMAELLRAKGNSTLAVTEFITQYAEQGQLHAMYSQPPPNASMNRGSQVHQELEDRVLADPTQLVYDKSVLAKLDRNVAHYINFVDKIIGLGRNLSNEHGVARELPIRGCAPGSPCILRGVIDCIYRSNDGMVIMETKTTRRESPTLLRLAYHQALTYHYLFQTLLKSDPDVLVPAIFDKDVPDMDLARQYYQENAAEVKAAINLLAGVGMAPYVNLQILSPTSPGRYRENVYEVEYDSQVLEEVIRSRVRYFNDERGVYDFQLPEVLSSQSFQATTSDKKNRGSLSAAEIAALRI